MTPEEFEKEMDRITDSNDKESAHKEADSLIVKLLRELGYENGADLYAEATEHFWWYA
jgi:hypothetical protein